MEFTLDYLYEHLMYDLIIDGITYHGNMDYVSSHFGYGTQTSFCIAASQEKVLQSFVNEYFETLKIEPNLKIEEFYNRKAI